MPQNTNYKKEYYLKNKEKIILKHKLYRKNNLDKVRKLEREARGKKKEIYNANRRAFYTANKSAIQQRNKKWRENNKEKILFYREKNRERNSLKNKEYHQKNKQNINKRKLEYRKNNIQATLTHNLRSRLNSVLKGKQKIGSAIDDLGCTVSELKDFLEKKFVKGMNWKNYSRNIWHIDHIKPISLFNLTDRRQFLEACHYTNLQPMWARENFSKGNRI